MVLAAGAQGNERKFSALVTIGLGDANVLGWSWTDNLTYVTKRVPREPTFSAVAFIDKISPLPLAMIYFSKDEYVPMEEAKRPFERAREPKRFFPIQARNHHFDGNWDTFFNKLREALEWISGIQR